ncbi:hypothetical protein BV898_07684 [Hypsibius exemplaris]|uniref:Odorant receptor n=1 Tax=Hypsibius exemplaris TaxID=2072580 RepID=A0A1W0WSV3_HYPEX|nr:hypothetical protein BV898_07684 [Hypsibius exemplaris]
MMVHKKIDRKRDSYFVPSMMPMMTSSPGTTFPAEPEIDSHAFFRPLLTVLHYAGFLDFPRTATQKCLDAQSDGPQHACHNCCRRAGRTFVQACRMGYLVLVWTWSLIISINIFYLGVNPGTDGSINGNMVIALLEEMPFAFLALRSAAVLTSFVIHSQEILIGIDSCEALRIRLSMLGGKVTFQRYRNRPLIYIISCSVVIVLFEVYEWNVWFRTGEGTALLWDFRPFPMSCIQLYYGCFWWAFTSIPFILAQLALCVPVLFAYVLRRFVRYINKELIQLAENVANAKSARTIEELGVRLTQLRAAHFNISELMKELDKTVNRMLLIQFIGDIVTLFGFVGLLINSKDAKNPSIELLEWTFYIPASFTWFFYFLFFFSFPLIHLSEEGERTHYLIHALTFSSATLFQNKMEDLTVFLSETKISSIAFTGGHFYPINRHYIVTCCALITSYLLVLTEILDRYYGTEELKGLLANLTQFVAVAESYVST